MMRPGLPALPARVTIGGVRPQFSRLMADPASTFRMGAITSGRKAPRGSGTDMLGPQPYCHADRPAELADIEPGGEPVTGFYRQHGYTEDQLIFMEKWLHPDLPPPE
jgi:hypothetical protein